MERRTISRGSSAAWHKLTASAQRKSRMVYGTRRRERSFPLPGHLFEARTGDDDGFVALRAGRDAAYLNACLFLQEGDVVFGALRQLLENRNSGVGSLPSRQTLIDRRQRFETFGGGR